MSAPITFRELLSRYQAGERDFAGSELDEDPDGDLAGLCLDGIDLSCSYVIAGFRGASLRGARFHNANLKTCEFDDADLTGADFTEAALCATSFKGARLDGARFEGAYYHSHTLAAGEVPDW